MTAANDKQNPYLPPVSNKRVRPRLPFALIALTALCGMVSVVCFALMIIGVSRILETTPFMGISVDATGRPIEPEGYLTIVTALGGLVLSITLGAICALCARSGR